MTIEQVFSDEVTENNASPFPIGVRILVVESDPTCLRIVSKMLQAYGYEVTTAAQATDALRILREEEDEINLILTEAHLPDMDQYEVLETVREMSYLPIAVFSADNNESAMLGCLYKGAALYLTKPIIKNDVKNLWQLTYRKKIKTSVSSEASNSFLAGSSEENASSVTVGTPSLFITMGQIDQNRKRKDLEETDHNDDEDNDNLTVPKKPKLVWTNELHNRFLQAIRVLGIDDAHPKKILQHMNVSGLKKENVSSHLQKYRLSLKREQDAMQKSVIRDPHPSPAFNLQGGLSEYTNPQFFVTAYQSEYGNNFHNSLCSPMSMHSFGSAQSPNLANTNYNGTLVPNYGQVAPQSKQLYPAYPSSSHTGITSTTDGNFASSGQQGNICVEEYSFNQGTTLSNVGTHCPAFQGNFQQPADIEGGSGSGNNSTVAALENHELLEMEREFLDEPNNDLWV